MIVGLNSARSGGAWRPLRFEWSVPRPAPPIQSLDGSAAESGYRPDLDGLRAVAILSVIGFHAFPSLMKSGFVGVDLFFVISGYLITSIILRDINTQSFSFHAFYVRRIRRIFPALVVVLAATWIAGWVVLLPNDYAQIGKHITAGAGF